LEALWYLGTEDIEWDDNILKEKPRLFSLNETDNTYFANILTLDTDLMMVSKKPPSPKQPSKRKTCNTKPFYRL
jgi:hypothetical protein